MRRLAAPEAFWGAVLAVGAVVEFVALYRRVHRWTASAFTRRALGIDPGRRWGRFGAVAWCGFLLWFAVHIVAGRGPSDASP